MSEEGEGRDGIQPDEFGMWDADAADRAEARFRLSMEPYHERERAGFPYGLAVLVIFVAGLCVGLLMFGIMHVMGELRHA